MVILIYKFGIYLPISILPMDDREEFGGDLINLTHSSKYIFYKRFDKQVIRWSTMLEKDDGKYVHDKKVRDWVTDS